MINVPFTFLSLCSRVFLYSILADRKDEGLPQRDRGENVGAKTGRLIRHERKRASG